MTPNELVPTLDLRGFRALIGPSGAGKTAIMREIWNADRKQHQYASVAWIDFSPGELVYPCFSICQENDLHFQNAGGLGLPSVVTAMARTGKLKPLLADMYKRFPMARPLEISERSCDRQLHWGHYGYYPPAGVVLYLAMSTLSHLRARVLLVQHPDRCIHPSMLKHVADHLRRAAKTKLVVIETHNPLLLNYLKGEEIYVITRDAKTGSHATRLSEVPNFELAMKIYPPGSFWCDFADGLTEVGLLGTGQKRRAARRGDAT